MSHTIRHISLHNLIISDLSHSSLAFCFEGLKTVLAFILLAVLTHSAGRSSVEKLEAVTSRLSERLSILHWN